METTTDQVNRCPNCGGYMSYDYLTHANKCQYCGSEFKLAQDTGHYKEEKPNLSADANIFAGTMTQAAVMNALFKELSQSALTPVDIFASGSFSKPQLVYIPLYNVKYSYSASWECYKKTKETKYKDALSYIKKMEDSLIKNGEVTAEVSKVCLGASPLNLLNCLAVNKPVQGTTDTKLNDIRQEYLAKSLILCVSNIQLAAENIKPFDSSLINKGDHIADYEFDSDEVWRREGRNAIEADIPSQINDPDVNVYENKLVTHFEHKVSEATKVYVPVWCVICNYNGEAYIMYINGVDGKVSGESIISNKYFLVDEKKFIAPTILTGFALWIMLYFYRLKLPDAQTNLSHHNNLLFSPIGGVYWWIRGALLLGIIPWLLIKYVPQYLNDLNLKLSQTKRDNELAKFLKSPAAQAYTS